MQRTNQRICSNTKVRVLLLWIPMVNMSFLDEQGVTNPARELACRRVLFQPYSDTPTYSTNRLNQVFTCRNGAKAFTHRMVCHPSTVVLYLFSSVGIRVAPPSPATETVSSFSFWIQSFKCLPTESQWVTHLEVRLELKIRGITVWSAILLRDNIVIFWGCTHPHTHTCWVIQLIAHFYDVLFFISAKKKKPKLLNTFEKTIKAEIDTAEKLRKKVVLWCPIYNTVWCF